MSRTNKKAPALKQAQGLWKKTGIQGFSGYTAR